jgi:hypothetical protein
LHTPRPWQTGDHSTPDHHPTLKERFSSIRTVLLEANDEWQLQHRYMSVEAMGEMLSPAPTKETMQLLPRSA